MVALALAIAVGAWRHPGLSLGLGLVLAVVAFAVRAPALLCLAGFVLAAALGTRAVDGLDPVAPAAFRGTVTLLADPAETPFGLRVDVRTGHRRVELEASGSAAGAVAASLAGEQVRVEGRVGPPPSDAPWLVPRHVVGRLRVERAERAGEGAAPWRAANRLRRLLARGAEALPADQRALYAGFVLGDDRGQSPAVVDDFRGAGLTHLLVVSGQNVAFLLVVISPLTARLGLGGRWMVTLVVIAGFAVLTRFEPSVLRASAMAALAVTARWWGRPTGSLRLLALAVSGLLLVDPLLVRSVGFQLSVAASTGIAVLAGPLAERLPGPGWWREALAVTVAAQLGVAPVLVPQFGGIPVVSIPANVLAVPVAGLVTTWGLPAGVAAGLGGPAVATVAHGPTRLLIGWVAEVARVASSVPLGDLGLTHLALLVIAGAVWWWAGRRAVRLGAVAVVVAVLAQPALALAAPPATVALGDGGRVCRIGGATVVVVGGRTQPEPLLQDLRRAGVRRIDLVALAGGATGRSGRLVAGLRHRWRVGTVVDASSPGAWQVGRALVRTGLAEASSVTVSGPDPGQESCR